MKLQTKAISIMAAGLLASAALFAGENPTPKPAEPSKEAKSEKADDKATKKKPTAPKGTIRATQTRDGY